jgi:hypothetical protein
VRLNQHVGNCDLVLQIGALALMARIHLECSVNVKA